MNIFDIIAKEGKQYLKDAMPGGLLNPELDYQGLRKAGEVASMIPTPVGDVASGLLAVDDLRNRQYGSAALNSIGLLPFVPGMAGMMKIKGRGTFPESRADVEKLSKRLGGLLDDAGADIVRADKSAVSPSEYFYLNTGKEEPIKIRISDHADRYVSDFSIAPGDSSFEEAIKYLRDSGISVGDKVKPIGALRDKLRAKFAYGVFDDLQDRNLYDSLWEQARNAKTKKELDLVEKTAIERLGYKIK